MIIIGFNEYTGGISSAGRYHKGLTNLDNLMTTIPDKLVDAFNKDKFWTSIFGYINPNMTSYKTKLGYYIVDTEPGPQYPQQSYPIVE